MSENKEVSFRRWAPSSLALISLCALNVVLIFSLPGKYSYVYNENGRLASGLIHLRTGDYSTFHVNPPLPDMIGAVPAFVGGNYCPTPGDFGMSHFGRKEYRAGDVWIEKTPDHFQGMKYGRRCMLSFVLLGTIVIFLFTEKLFGLLSAIIASLVWMFSPYILGFGCLVCPDVASASLAIAAVYMFWKWLQGKTYAIAMWAGIALGIAELTKFTLLILYPVSLLLWILYRIPDVHSMKRNDWIQQVKQLVVYFFVSLLVINMGYLFENVGKPLGEFRFQTTFFTGCKTLDEVPSNGGNRFSGTLLGYLPMPLPANYIQGIDTQRLDFERGLPSYLRGEWSDHGWWHFYLYALLIKTPLGTLGLLVLAVVCTLLIRDVNVSWQDEMVVLLPGIVILAFVSSQSGFSIHSRYVIPALPFFFIWISKIGQAMSWKRPILSGIAMLLIGWSIISSLWVYPHSISYFNELTAVLSTQKANENYPNSDVGFSGGLMKAGPLNGPRHLLDSNIDWGQDLFYLERWCKEHPEAAEIQVAYWGSYPISQTMIPDRGLPPANAPRPGWYALSVNYLYDRERQYRYFLNFKPVAMAGYSIYIYHITQEDIDRIRPHWNSPKISSVFCERQRNIIQWHCQ